VGARATAASRLASRLPAGVVRELRRPQLAFLATSSAAGRPATTLLSWLYAVDRGRVLLALDRRGLAYSDLLENPYAAIEVILPGFVASLRGSVEMVADELCRAPFCCTAALLEIEEVRDHAVAGVDVAPPGYRFTVGREGYVAAEAAVFEELHELGKQVIA
jgi:hypothetical protein